MFGVGCGDDLDRAIDILLSAVADHDWILADPEPTVRVTDLGPTGAVDRSGSPPAPVEVTPNPGRVAACTDARYWTFVPGGLSP